jgi:hypothetical protein
MRHHAIGASDLHFLIFPIKSVEKWQVSLENVRKSGRIVSKKCGKVAKTVLKSCGKVANSIIIH